LFLFISTSPRGTTQSYNNFLKNLIPLYFLYAFAKLNSALCLQGVEFTFSNEVQQVDTVIKDFLLDNRRTGDVYYRSNKAEAELLTLLTDVGGSIAQTYDW